MDGSEGRGGLAGDIKDAVARGDTAYLLEALEGASLEVKVAAVAGLGELGSESARLALTRIARDRWGERPEVRLAALRALGRVLEPSRFATLLDEFITEDNRKVVAGARAMLRDTDPAGFPLALVRHGCVDHNAIRVYGDAAEPSAAPLLERFLSERMAAGDLASGRQWGKAYAAVRALGNIDARGAVDTLESLLAWVDEREGQAGGLSQQRLAKVRQEAARVLERARKV